ncbi:MAG: YkgJ family cysteine cluster protein [Pseudomonadota bacterium]
MLLLLIIVDGFVKSGKAPTFVQNSMREMPAACQAKMCLTLSCHMVASLLSCVRFSYESSGVCDRKALYLLDGFVKSSSMTNMLKQNECTRCGACCEQGGPALHKADVPVLAKGIVKRSDVYTIRKGETVYNNFEQKLMTLTEEIIKIKGIDGQNTACIFYNSTKKECSIYPDRPYECKALKCWDTSDMESICSTDRLCRKDLLPDDTPLTELMAAHEERCSYILLNELLHRIKAADDASKVTEKVIDQIRFDYYLREFVSDKFKIKSDELALFFGRPMIKTIETFGLHVQQENDVFLLAPIDNSNPSPGNKWGRP